MISRRGHDLVERLRELSARRAAGSTPTIADSELLELLSATADEIERLRSSPAPAAAATRAPATAAAPEAAMTPDAAGKLARKARLPRFMFDTQQCREALVRFALVCSSEPAAQPEKAARNPEVVIDYTNYKGERAWRRIAPIELHYGSNQFHTEAQWLLRALDLDKGLERTFAVRDIHAWGRDPGDKNR